MVGLNLSDEASRNLGAVLRLHAEQRPDAVFLMSDDGNRSFGEINDAVNRLANGLASRGIAKGDRVAIMMGSRSEFVLLVLAVNKLGAIWVPINPDYRGDWLADAINDAIPAMFVTEKAMSERVAEVVDRLPPVPILVVDGLGALAECERAAPLDSLSNAPATEPDVVIAPGDTAAILFTSGTTGRPKGVMQSHSAWINTAEHGNRMFETTEQDVVYSCLPLYNSAAWSASILRALVAGIPVAIDPHFSVSNFWSRIRKFGATQTMSLGAMHIFLWNLPETPEDAENTLRCGAMTPMPGHLLEPFCKRFGIDFICEGYGQSEVMTLMNRISRPGSPITPNALGSVNPVFEVRLVDDDGNEVPIGEAGEFAVRQKQPNLMFNGYFNNPQATADAYRHGWYHTGDLGRLDADGNYYFVDRKKDYIRYKGRSVSSFQIEHVAGRHPDVAACAAFGVTSAELETEAEIKLDVVPKPDTTIDPAELARFINDNAPYFLVPRYIEIVGSLPHTPTNKVEKYKLRAKGVTPQTWDRMAEDFALVR